MSEYLVIIEGEPGAYGAYIPDLPGCVAVGKNMEEVRHLIREAIPFHLQGLSAAGEPAPQAASILVDFVPSP